MDSLYGYSYVVLDLWPWMDLLNESFNPLDRQISSSQLDVVYKQGGEYYATQELRGEYYYKPVPAPASPTPDPEDTEPTEGDDGSGIPATVIPEPSPEPTPTPEPEGQAAVVTEEP